MNIPGILYLEGWHTDFETLYLFFKTNYFITQLTISFISVTLLQNQPCYKFMLTYDIENYLQQFTKFLSKLY